jgi:hypothetical protein
LALKKGFAAPEMNPNFSDLRVFPDACLRTVSLYPHPRFFAKNCRFEERSARHFLGLAEPPVFSAMTHAP